MPLYSDQDAAHQHGYLSFGDRLRGWIPRASPDSTAGRISGCRKRRTCGSVPYSNPPEPCIIQIAKLMHLPRSRQDEDFFQRHQKLSV